MLCMLTSEREIEDMVVRVVLEKLKANIDLAVASYLEQSVRRHLEEIIATAKEEATKQIAAKLLRLAFEPEPSLRRPTL